MLEPAETLLGQLQRGLGSGVRALAVGARPDATELLLACIADDPRWDGQLDSRADYYARLSMRIGVPVAQLERLVIAAESQSLEVDPGQCLALEVLKQMAVLGCSDAEAAIRRYVRDGRYWGDAIQSLVCESFSFAPRAGWRERVDGLVEDVVARFPTVDLLAQAIREWGSYNVVGEQPWVDWESGVALIHDTVAYLRAEPKAVTHSARMEAETTAGLLAITDRSLIRVVAQQLLVRNDVEDVVLIRRAAEDPDAPMRIAAIHAMAFRGDADVLQTIVEMLSTTRPGGARRLLTRALTALPYEATRHVAMSWLKSDDSTARNAAAIVVEKHAIADDVAVVQAALDHEVRAGEDGDQYIITSLAGALERHPEQGPYPVLEQAFYEMPYSYGRHFVIDAIAATDPTFGQRLAIDALWDAEPQVRVTAARHADRSNTEVTNRLNEIAQDSHEEPAVRKAAAPI